MTGILYRGRRAASIENEHLQVVVTEQGGHIAAIIDKASGVNPLWSPPWRTTVSSLRTAPHSEPRNSCVAPSLWKKRSAI